MKKVNNFYLTEIKESENKKTKSKGKRKTQKVSSYLVKNSKNFEKTTTEFLDFMLNDHFHLADMTKLEEYFRTKGIESYKRYDSQVDEINKKKKLLIELDKQIEHEIISNLKFDPTSIEEAFRSEIENYKKQIEEKEYDLLTYTNEYERLTKENIQIKGEFKEKLKYSKIFGKQHEKYTFIRNNIETQFNIHQNLFNDMKNYEWTTRNYYERELKKKKMIYTKTEYDVFETKNEIMKYKSELEGIRNLINEKVDLIEMRKKGNEKILEEHKLHLKEYFKDFVRLDRIFQDLKEGDLNVLITKFKQEILKLNEIYSRLNKELIKQKTHHNRDNIFQDETKKTEADLEEIESLYNFLIKDNKATSEIIFSRRNFLKNIVNFCVKYDKEISEMIKSFYYQELKIDQLPNSKKEYILMNNNDIHLDEIIDISDDWGTQEYKLFMNFFFKFLRKLNFIRANFEIEIASKSNSCTIQSDKKIFGVNSEEINIIVNDVIFEFEKNREQKLFLRSSVNNVIKVKTDNLDKKMKDFSLSHKTTIDDLFSNFYQKLYFNKINPEENSNTVISDVFLNLKSKFYKKICQFTNDSVDNLHNSKNLVPITLPKEPLPLTENNNPLDSSRKSLKGTEAINNPLPKISNNEESILIKDDPNNFKNLDKNISPINSVVDTRTPEKSTYQGLDDSYHSEKAISIEEKKKKKNYNFFGYSKNKEESLAAVYRRIVDLNTLENKIFKNNNKNQEKINNNNFSELFYNIRKKIKKSADPSKITRNSTAPKTSYNEKKRNSLIPPSMDTRVSLFYKNLDFSKNKKKTSSSNGIRRKLDIYESKEGNYKIADNERLIVTTTNWKYVNTDTNNSTKNSKNFPCLFNRTGGFSVTKNYTNKNTEHNLKLFK